MPLSTGLKAGLMSAMVAGLVGVPGVAVADDAETRRATALAPDYRMTLREIGDDRDRLKVTFAIDSNKANRVWNFRVFRAGNPVAKATKRTGPAGNVVISRKFRGDDDNRVRVVARAGYGERCERGFRLDD